MITFRIEKKAINQPYGVFEPAIWEIVNDEETVGHIIGTPRIPNESSEYFVVDKFHKIKAAIPSGANSLNDAKQYAEEYFGNMKGNNGNGL
jgi:hypothetical protein